MLDPHAYIQFLNFENVAKVSNKQMHAAALQTIKKDYNNAHVRASC